MIIHCTTKTQLLHHLRYFHIITTKVLRQKVWSIITTHWSPGSRYQFNLCLWSSSCAEALWFLVGTKVSKPDQETNTCVPIILKIPDKITGLTVLHINVWVKVLIWGMYMTVICKQKHGIVDCEMSRSIAEVQQLYFCEYIQHFTDQTKIYIHSVLIQETTPYTLKSHTRFSCRRKALVNRTLVCMPGQC